MENDGKCTCKPSQMSCVVWAVVGTIAVAVIVATVVILLVVVNKIPMAQDRQECSFLSLEDATLVKSSNYSRSSDSWSKVCYRTLVRPNSNQVAHIMMTDLDLPLNTDCDWDYSEFAAKFANSCGRSLPLDPMDSNNSPASHSMPTGEGWVGRGFKLLQTWTDKSCGGILTNRTGNIAPPTQLHEGTKLAQWPQWPFPVKYEYTTYDNNLDCRWVIPTDKPRAIRLTWPKLSLQKCADCTCDYVQVGTVVGNTEEVFGRYCNTTPELVISQDVDFVTVLFHSDEKENEGGFELKYEVK